MIEEISERDAQYVLDLVKSICTQVGPGLPGSTQERGRAAMIERELVAHLGAENVTIEEFTLAPRALLDSQMVSTLCMLAAVALNIAIGAIWHCGRGRV